MGILPMQRTELEDAVPITGWSMARGYRYPGSKWDDTVEALAREGSTGVASLCATVVCEA